ncbi:MAG: hypothetical protein HQ592_16410 [Planctomycetes bacterium]|nr:hypothetical protein [Planctomycetota bacterium]
MDTITILYLVAAVVTIAGAVFGVLQWTRKRIIEEDWPDQFQTDIRDMMESKSTDALLFIAFYRIHPRRKPIIFDERLSDQRNSRFLRGGDPAERGERYKSFVRDLHRLVGQLNRQLAPFEQGDLLRIVLDVSYGGCFYYKISTYDYVFGVTLNQTKMLTGDKEMREIATAIQRHFGVPTLQAAAEELQARIAAGEENS